MTRASPVRLDPKLDLVLECIVDVPKELVWKAWTQPELLKQWFTPKPWSTVDCELDLRPGGIFRTVMRSPEGQDFTNLGCYLEVVGPDWEQPAPAGPRLFGVDSLSRPILSTFALSADDLDLMALRVRNAGFSLGPIRSMSRRSADGVGIRWRMTPPIHDLRFGRLLPFVVEWGDSPHPADRAARGCSLKHLTVHTRDVGELGARLTILGTDVPVLQRDTPALVAVLDTPAGRVVLD